MRALGPESSSDYVFTNAQRRIVAHRAADPLRRNARTHSEQQITQIAASIAEFGFCNPILSDPEGGIIAGHGRVLAARQIAMPTVPVILLGHLTENQRRALRLADNQLALNASWDENLLRAELEALIQSDFDIEITGFDQEELDQLLTDLNQQALVDSDQAPALQ